MKKLWFTCLNGVTAILLLGGGFVLGNDSTPVSPVSPESATQLETAPAPPSENLKHGGLTPKRKAPATTDRTVVLAQEPSRLSVKSLPPQAAEPTPLFMAAAPVPAPSSDAYVLAEIERLSAEVQKLKKDTKKPDTKKAWGSPKITGRLFLDSFATEQNDGADATYLDSAGRDQFRNKAGIREMQFAISGNGFDAFDYKLELSLAPNSGRVNLVDNWIGVKNLPLFGYVRAGHFKPETGLNYPASALHTTLTEFTGPTSTFGFGRRFGVASETLYCKDRIRLFYGVFQDGATNTDRFIHDDDQGEVFNIRLSMAPYYEQEGRHVFHVGGHWSYVSSRRNTTSLSARPGSIAWYDASLTTGNFENNNHHRAGAELAWQAGPFAIQSEAFVAKYAGHGAAPERTATGAYVELKYFLTGEHRAYNLKKGMFGAAKVNRNFHPFACGDFNLVDGFGAWQAVLQYSYLDLDDWRQVSAKAGRQHDITVGMNWFWTPNLRWVFEYTHSQQNIGSNHLYCYEDIFGTSLRVHF